MMKKIAGIIRCAAFLLILALTLGAINGVLLPKYYYFNAYWPSSTTFNQFYALEEDTVDVLFLGSSVAMNAFSPMQIYKDYGIRSFNLGSEQQSPFLSYYWLKEALRTQSPKAVVMDARFCYNYREREPINTEEGLTRKTLDQMRLSPVKMQAVHDLCARDVNHSELSYYLPNIRYHDRWKELDKTDFYQGEYKYSKLMGYCPGTDTHPDEYITFDPKDAQAETNELHAVSMEYLDRMAVLCREEGIEMILVNIAGNEISDGIHNAYTAFAQKHGIDYYNFCETAQYQAVGAKFPEESIFRHVPWRGGVKMSQYMGRLLRDEYGIEGVQDVQWEENLPFYENFLRMQELPSIYDLEAYLAALPDGDCTIFMTVKDDAYTGMSEGTKAQLRRLGLHTEWNEGMARQPYMAILSEGRVIEGAGGYQSYSSRFEGGRYDVLSIGYQDGNVASVKINGEECSVNRRGLNIVVYSHYQDKVIDSVSFDLQEGACIRMPVM